MSVSAWPLTLLALTMRSYVAKNDKWLACTELGHAPDGAGACAMGEYIFFVGGTAKHVCRVAQKH